VRAETRDNADITNIDEPLVKNGISLKLKIFGNFWDIIINGILVVTKIGAYCSFKEMGLEEIGKKNQ